MGKITPEGTKTRMNPLSDAKNNQSDDMESLFVLHKNPLVGMPSQSQNLRSQGAGPTKRPDGWLFVGSVG